MNDNVGKVQVKRPKSD